jgi:hypothetical protein
MAGDPRRNNSGAFSSNLQLGDVGVSNNQGAKSSFTALVDPQQVTLNTRSRFRKAA